MKKNLFFPIAFLLFLCTQKSAAQTPDTLRFQVCPEMWSTFAPVAIDSVGLLVYTQSFPVAPYYFYPQVGEDCIEIAIPTAMISGGNSFQIVAYKGDDGLNGLTVNDIWVKTNHILGIVPMTNIAQLIAADVNGSGSITTFDIVELRKKLLGINSSNFFWGSVPDYWTFPNPANPFGGCDCDNLAFAELLAYHNGTLNLSMYKKGDVDGDADPQNTYVPSVVNVVKLVVENQVLTPNVLRDISFSINPDWTGIGTFQFELKYDPTKMEILEASGPNFSIGINIVGSSVRIVGSTSTFGMMYAGELFKLKVRGLQNTQISDVLYLNTSDFFALAVAAAPNSSQPILVGLDWQILSDQNDIFVENSRFEVFPNPSSSEVFFVFDAPVSEDTELIISDLSGKKLNSLIIRCAVGENKIALPAGLFAGEGAYFVSLVLGGDVVTRRLIRS